MSLHVREKKNKSGSISIQIVDRKNRGYKVVETVGCARNENEKRVYLEIANKRVSKLKKELYPNLFDLYEEKEDELEFLSIYNKEIIPIGDELIFGRLFKELGCDKIAIKDKNRRLFKALVISRILYPGSKLYLIDYLSYFKQEYIDKNQIYRFLDNLYTQEIKSQIEECVFNHTKNVTEGDISVTFYDVTTLHFESESEDDLRRIGFSKEGKLNRPQILLGLFTTLQGYPLSYEVYEGNKYEGHTLIDILEKFQKKFKLPYKPIVVADRGMLNNANIAYLEKNGYKYILAYKIKNIPDELKAQIANLTFINDSTIHTINLNKKIEYKDENGKKHLLSINQRLILTYSSKRARKDKKTREKAIEKIEATLNNKNITKSDLKLSYYAKYLDIDNNCSIKYRLNPQKIELDSRLDGIKGFATNDFTLHPNDVVTHYQNQYQVEKAFRISKTDLQIRPIYHRLENRIKAHILISFVAYAVYKEFDRRLKAKNVNFNFSDKLVRDIIKHMNALKINGKLYYFKFDEIQEAIYYAIKSK